MQGTTIDKYLLEAVLGSGGMGTVYRARHLMLGRSAAVKLLLPELSANAGFVQRFFNEARAASSVHHLGIVEVYDYGRMADGVAYIAMELLHGETLARRLQRGLDAVSALRFARLICGALGAAHDRGIVHRDLKPDNVFIIRDDEITGGERIKLLDFGIAKLTLDPAWTASHQTRTGTLIGTPAYMAPEQCRGVEIDWRADIYALGCILYEVFGGRPPFRGDGVGDVLGAHMYLAPPPIAAVPPAIWRLIDRMLAKQPAERPQTTGQIVEAIETLLAAGVEPTIAPRLPGAAEAASAASSEQSEASTLVVPPAPSPAAAQPAPSPATVLLSRHAAGAARAAGDDRAAGLPPGAGVPPGAGDPALASDAPLLPSAAVGSQRPAHPRRRRGLAIGAVLGSIGLASAVAIATSQGGGSARVPPGSARSEVVLTPVEPSVEAAPKAAAAPAAAPGPTRPTLGSSSGEIQVPPVVHVRIDSTPRGSQVVLDGRKIGTTPFEIDLPRGDRARIFALRRAGFQDAQLEVRGDVDIDRSIALTPGRSTLPGRAPKPPRRTLHIGSDEEINPFAP
jgi:serine/threonine-protein kinase